MKQKRYSNQSKIFREITASKIQEQHAAQFNFRRYEGLCPATKTEYHTQQTFFVFQDVLKTSLAYQFFIFKDVFRTPSRCRQHVFTKTNVC